MSFGSLTLLAPLTLLGLLALPIIWWIMRISPPQPRRQAFPPLRILQDIDADEQTPDKTPLWLLLFRIFMAALIIFALAKPIFQSQETSRLKPLTLIIDQSVTAAPHWAEIITDAEARSREARRKNLNVRLIASGETLDSLPEFSAAQNALTQLKSLKPLPFHVGDENYKKLLKGDALKNTDIVWLTSGISTSGIATSGISENKNQLLKGTGAQIIRPELPRLVMPANIRETPQGFDADWYRPSASGTQTVTIEALGADNSVIAAQPLTFGLGETLGRVSFSLPAQLRARVARLRAAGLRSAAAIKLLDDSFGRPIVGVLTPPADTSSPLLTEPFYAKQALLPYADIFEGDESTLLALEPSVIIMPDSMKSDSEAIRKYVETGGLLIRFAGPRLAKRVDDLIPVRLRSGGRAIGGALAWEDPQRLASFDQDSPFFGLAIPQEVTVSKQVMAEPGIETDRKTWARLEDRSPIVTTDIFGQGRVVLFHVTAGPEWSNLAINGLYVDMLRRILPLAKSRTPVQTQSGADWVLDRTLDGFGNFTTPPARSQILKDEDFQDMQASAKALPGYYRQGTRQRSLQPISNPAQMRLLDLPSGTREGNFGDEKSSSIMGLLLAIGAGLLALDAIFALFMSGRLRYLIPKAFTGSRIISSLIAIALIVVVIPQARAQETPQINSTSDNNKDSSTPRRIIDAARGLHLAYIETGDSRRDNLTQTALESLKRQLNARTTIEPAGVHAVLPSDDGLHLYPFLYWSIRRDTPALTPEAARNLNSYMSSGGTIIFDTADEGERLLRAGTPHPGLARVTENLDIPALNIISADHVLTKSYYLTQVFPGRWANGPVYVQSGEISGGGRDGVSPVIIGSADWAAAWAIDADAGALIDINKDIPRQREMSIRFGINLAMYALAGNYKADQVHAAELIKRVSGGDQALPALEPEE